MSDFVHFAMGEYRAYVVGLDGHFVSFEGFTCGDDGEAIAKAQRLLDGHDVELWSGERFVRRLKAAENHDGEAISHEIIDARMVPKK